jgi:hypothetical protein
MNLGLKPPKIRHFASRLPHKGKGFLRVHGVASRVDDGASNKYVHVLLFTLGTFATKEAPNEWNITQERQLILVGQHGFSNETA